MGKIMLAASCLGLLLTASCTSTNPAANNNAPAGGQTVMEHEAKAPPENVVTAQVDEVQLKPGGEGEAKVNLAIVDPYHVHANPATLKNLIATTLTVTPPEGVTASAPVYPPSKTMKFEFDDTPLAVYAGTATIAVRLKAGPKRPTGAVTVPAKLRYQACDDAACYPPKTIDVSIPLNIK